MGRRRFLGRVSGRDCSSYLPGLYTISELDQMIFVDGYIPVANATEFDNIRTGVAETMGAGTCWENKYTTGGDKKYVQVKSINFSNHTCSAVMVTYKDFIYDGNELICYGYNIPNGSPSSPSFITSNTARKFNARNIIADSFDLKNTAHNYAALIDNCDGEVENCKMLNSTISISGAQIAGILARGTANVTKCEVSYCDFTGDTVFGISAGGVGDVSWSKVVGTNLTATNYCAGITRANSYVYECEVRNCVLDAEGTIAAGISSGQGDVYRCVVDGCKLYVTSAERGACGIVQLRNNSISFCKVINLEIHSNSAGAYVGGLAPNYRHAAKVECCEVINIYINTPNKTRVGGLIGADDAATDNILENCRVIGGTIIGSSAVGGVMGRVLQNKTKNTNCFSTAEIISGGNAGGAYGGTQNNGVISGVYWDKQTSGWATSVGGVGYNTSDLQTPTSATGIYANWDPLIWDFGTSSEYPKLINTP